MICDYCGREMSDPATVDCTVNRVVVYPDGECLPATPFAAPLRCETTGEWMARWRQVHPPGCDSLVRGLDSEEQARERCAEYQKHWDRCVDCRVKGGGYHHPGCHNERCPRCGGQLISCGCLDDDDEECDE